MGRQDFGGQQVEITQDYVGELDAKRFRFLMRAYEILHKTFANSFIDSDKLGEEIGLDHLEANSVAKYLVDRGLLKRVGMDSISITTEGLMEVEEAIRKPERETEFFPQNIYNITVNEMKN